jgi:hypothetical protein
LNIFFSIIFCYIWISIFGHSFVYRRSSFLCSIATPENLFVCITVVINFINGIVAYAPPLYDYLFNLVNAICCFSVFFYSKTFGGFVSVNISTIVKTFGLGSFLNYFNFTFSPSSMLLLE